MSLSNTEYDEILRSYEEKQTKNRLNADKRKEEIYGKDSRLSEIDSAIASLAVEQAEKILSGDKNALSDMHEKMEELRREKREILKGLGCDEDVFAPSYECPDCRDTGFIDGKRCHCFRQKRIDRIYQQSNLSQILLRENFDHFSLDYYSDDPAERDESGDTPYEAAKHAVDKCYRFIESFGSEFHNLLFYGTTGVGKTYLSNCVAKALLDAGYSVVYFTAPQLFDILEQDVFGKDASAKEMRKNIDDVDLLIIDDLGTENVNSFTSAQIYRILNERMLKEKSTVISTNLQIGELRDHYSERSFSRILGVYTLIRLFGADIRLQKLQKKR